MTILLNNTSMVPIYEQLVSQIKHQILDGTLRPETMLPSVRALAGELKISALTVKKAYDFLEKEDFVVTVHGKGTYVKAVNAQLAEEFTRKTIEDSFAEAIDRAKAAGLSRETILEIVAVLLDT